MKQEEKRGTEVIRKVTRRLSVPLTDREQQQAGINLAQTNQDIAAEESRQAEQKASMKARLQELEARRQRESLVVSRKAEDREVDVEVLANWERGTASEVRTDTGEIISTRILTDEERQGSLIEA